MFKYKIIAYLINPKDEEGMKDESVFNDYDFISNISNDFYERVNCLKKYQGDFNAIEEHKFDVQFIIEEDSDGLYLLEKIV